MKSAHAVFALSAAVAMATPLSGHGVRVIARMLIHDVASPNSDEDELIVLEDGPVVLLQGYSSRGDSAAWLKFKMDECGLLQRVENEHSILRQSALSDDGDDPDDDQDPSVQGEDLIRTWLSEHPEIAVLNDGVDSWCSDGSFDDEGDAPAIIANWTARRGIRSSYSAAVAISGSSA
jgi:hypothetical protein